MILYHICTQNFEIEATEKFSSDEDALNYFVSILNNKLENRWINNPEINEVFLYNSNDNILNYYKINSELKGSYALKRKFIDYSEIRYHERISEGGNEYISKYEKKFLYLDTKYDVREYLKEKITKNVFSKDKKGIIYVKKESEYGKVYKFKYDVKYFKSHSYQLKELIQENYIRFFNKIDSQILKLF